VELGRAIKVMRTASGIKQKEIASRTGVTANYVSLVEAGKREPSISFLRQIAKVIGVPVGLFFLWEEGAGEKSPKSDPQVRALLTELEAMYLSAKRQKVARRTPG
jgi:XRE family transcriptional regulator, regulator of sulfur utilization